jgi:hypothetical protein
MESNQSVSELNAPPSKSINMVAAVLVIAAIGLVLFTNAPATARQTNPLRGSGEVLQGSLAAPSAGPTAGDPSVPSAADALRGQGFDRVPAVDAPTF